MLSQALPFSRKTTADSQASRDSEVLCGRPSMPREPDAPTEQATRNGRHNGAVCLPLCRQGAVLIKKHEVGALPCNLCSEQNPAFSSRAFLLLLLKGWVGKVWPLNFFNFLNQKAVVKASGLLLAYLSMFLSTAHLHSITLPPPPKKKNL